MDIIFLLFVVLSFLVFLVWVIHGIMKLTLKRGLLEKFKTKHYVPTFVGLFIVGFGGFAFTMDETDSTNTAQQVEETGTEEAEADTESASDTNEQEQRAEELEQQEQELEEREQALKEQEAKQEESAEEEESSDESTSGEGSKENEENSDSSEESSSESESSNELGETVSVGAVSFQIEDVSTASTVGSEYLSESADGTYIVLDVVYTNNGSEAAMVDSSQVRLKQDGKTFEADATASTYANSSDDPSNAADFFFSEVNPGSSLEGKVVFDVTDAVAEEEHLEAEVTEGVFGTKSAHITLK